MAQDIASEDTEADYGQAYEGFYSKYYDELEQFAKDFFIEKKSENRKYLYVRNKLEVYLYNDYVKDIHFLKNDNLMNLYSIFQNRASYYDNEFMLDVFKVEIKNDFNKIDIKQFPKNYNYVKFIQEVAIIESRTVIFSLISNLNICVWFEMIYKLNRFDFFEIRYYKHLPIEKYPHYEEMVLELRSKDGIKENLGVAENVLINPKKLPEKWYALLYWIEMSANGQQPPINKEGGFIKRDIEEYRKKITAKSGQSFYRSFIQIDLNNAVLLKNSFGYDWKNEIINLSNNNRLVIEYIKSKYTL